MARQSKATLTKETYMTNEELFMTNEEIDQMSKECLYENIYAPQEERDRWSKYNQDKYHSRLMEIKQMTPENLLLTKEELAHWPQATQDRYNSLVIDGIVFPVTASQTAQILNRIDDGTINYKSGLIVYKELAKQNLLLLAGLRVFENAMKDRESKKQQDERNL